MKKVGVISLGCAKNLVDTEKLLYKLKEGGAFLVSDPEDADVLVINTCGFIEPAKRESIESILEFAENKKVIVMGCLVQRYKEELSKEIPEVTAYFGTESWDQVVEFLNLKVTNQERRILTTPKSYAYLKIAEGCNRLCSFCAIPSIRGRHRSSPLESILSEAKDLVSQGVKELCIVSQDTTYYGRDLYGKDYFLKLLEELEKIQGLEWIRIMYMYPSEISDSLIDYIKNSKKVLPYFDMPLQHVSNKVLKSMRRGYTKEYILELLQKIHSHLPNAIVRTTFIVGYPEEGEKEFMELLDFVKEGYIHWLGAFIYYQEEGTHAYALGDPIPKKEKRERLKALLKAQKDVWKSKKKEFLGKEVKVLIDGYDKDTNLVPIGRTYMQAPEVDSVVYIDSERYLKPGDMVLGKVTRIKGYDFVVRVE